jgi:hypothetical protein
MSKQANIFYEVTGGIHPLAPKFKGPGFKDGHYRMMDWGEFVVKDGLAYFPNGDVVDTTICVPARWWPEDPKIESCAEDYSAWDDDRRCLEQSIGQAERELIEAEHDAYYATRAALVQSARVKLTEDEFDAVWEAGNDREKE